MGIRHQQPFLPVSILAQQWYCEKKVDLAMRYPGTEERSSEMEAGTAGHDQLESGSVPISKERLESGLSRGERFTLFELPLEGSWEEIAIWGRPDLVRLEGRSARLVVEFKFSRRQELFPSQQTQATLYAWLLQQNGFEVDQLLCAVVIFHPAHVPSRPLPSESLDPLLESIEILRPRAFRSRAGSIHRYGSPTLHLFPYLPLLAKERLRWAAAYWQEKREPVSSASKAKCRICIYSARGLCEAALI